jgi:hypothetical protein
MHVPAAENAENEMREGGWVGGISFQSLNSRSEERTHCQ